MKRTHFLIIMACLMFVIGLSASIAGQASARQTDEQRTYRLVWEDQFNGSKLDTTHWERIDRNIPAWRRYMTTHDKLYRQRGGYLRLYSKRNKNIDPTDTATVLTGGIQTQNHFHFSGYGKMEVRARIHGAQGCWPAIWITSVKYQNDPDWAEIDIMEHYNHDNIVVQTAHNNYSTIQNRQTEKERSFRPSVKAEDWNIYGVEILPDRLIFSVNGKETYTYHKINDPKVKHQFPYGVESYLRIDMQWNNPWLKPDINDLPAWMDIDWVRYYTLNQSGKQR